MRDTQQERNLTLDNDISYSDEYRELQVAGKNQQDDHRTGRDQHAEPHWNADAKRVLGRARGQWLRPVEERHADSPAWRASPTARSGLWFGLRRILGKLMRHEKCFRAKLKAEAEQYVFDRVKAGDFKPRIDRVFPFSQMVEAHRYMESNEQIGKIVVKVSGGPSSGHTCRVFLGWPDLGVFGCCHYTLAVRVDDKSGSRLHA